MSRLEKLKARQQKLMERKEDLMKRAEESKDVAEVRSIYERLTETAARPGMRSGPGAGKTPIAPTWKSGAPA